MPQKPAVALKLSLPLPVFPVPAPVVKNRANAPVPLIVEQRAPVGAVTEHRLVLPAQWQSQHPVAVAD